MKRLLCAGIALLPLLAGCNVPSETERTALTSRIVAFRAAVKSGDVKTVERMLKEDPGLGRMPSGDGYESDSPLRLAAKAGHTAVVEKLLEMSSPDVAEGAGVRETPLHDAAGPGRKAVVELLLKKGVRVDVVDGFGQTALFSAVSSAAVDSAQALLLGGANPNHRSVQRETPLHAVSPLEPAPAVLLCAAGADPTARAANGETPQQTVLRKVRDYSIVAHLVPTANALAAFLAPGGGCTKLAARKIPPGEREGVAKAGEYEIKCSAGEADSCRYAGVRYEHGTDGLKVDLARAGELYQLACDKGDVTGCGYLGWAWEKGFGRPVDLGRAHAGYQQACDKGDAWSCGSLADLYYDGRGVREDHAKAVELFRWSCEHGSAWSCGQLGHATENGYGVKADPAAAATLFEGACAKDNEYACWRLSVLLHEGRGVAKDGARAADLAAKACAAGEERACAPRGKKG